MLEALECLVDPFEVRVHLADELAELGLGDAPASPVQAVDLLLKILKARVHLADELGELGLRDPGLESVDLRLEALYGLVHLGDEAGELGLDTGQARLLAGFAGLHHAEPLLDRKDVDLDALELDRESGQTEDAETRSHAA